MEMSLRYYLTKRLKWYIYIFKNLTSWPNKWASWQDLHLPKLQCDCLPPGVLWVGRDQLVIVIEIEYH